MKAEKRIRGFDERRPRRERSGGSGTKGNRHRVLVLITLAAAALTAASGAYGGVEKVAGGVKFSYDNPDAGQVYLAGTFNNWSTTANPMQKDEKGYWTVVIALSSGKHEYKFVVDGAWITDFENPNTTPDPYGGANSAVELDAKGEIVVKAAATPTSNTALSSQVFIGGRYLSRTKVQRDVEDDPRWRMQRPVQNVDFNFRISISDMVHGYTRMRIDTEENFLQPNNIQLFLDEAHIEITPAPFTLRGYYNEEVLASGDPLGLIGDIDLPGTIFDDHVKAGKGTAGVVLTTTQRGLDIAGFIANVHDFDIENDPRLFDNTGTDLAHVRAARRIWKLTPAASFFFERNLWWLDFTSFVGSTPANTGLPRLDEYLDRSGDPSDWFEFEDELYLYGPDLTLHLMDDKLLPQVEFLWGGINQRFVTSNRSGINLDNGPVDVPIFERDLLVAHGSVRYTAIEKLDIDVEHTRYEIEHAGAGEGYLLPFFTTDDVANKHIFFVGVSDPPNVTTDYSEATLAWEGERFGARLRLERFKRTYDAPEGDAQSWLYELAVSPGLRWKPLERVEIELEHRYNSIDMPASAKIDQTTFETIGRGSIKVTRTLSAIFDVRNLYLDDEASGETDSYTAPFAGIRYQPTRKVDLVLAYGVDPLDFNIDYAGRQTGRWNFRQEYLWGHGGAPTPVYYAFDRPRFSLPIPHYAIRDAEQALADAKMIVLRVIYNF